MNCDYCGEPAELVGGAVLYPKLPMIAHKRFWKCTPCKAWVGCHGGTNVPLGRIADANLRRAKQRVHDAFDMLWESKKMTRSEAYEKLAKAMGMTSAECHIGMFDLATCNRAFHLVKGGL